MIVLSGTGGSLEFMDNQSAIRLKNADWLDDATLPNRDLAHNCATMSCYLRTADAPQQALRAES